MASRDAEIKLMNSPQFEQWTKHGMAELFADQGTVYWRWTDHARRTLKSSTLATVALHVMGLPLYPVKEDAERIEKLIRADWLKDGFAEDGFLLVDED